VSARKRLDLFFQEVDHVLGRLQPPRRRLPTRVGLVHWDL
jgi:hypothetical protein